MDRPYTVIGPSTPSPKRAWGGFGEPGCKKWRDSMAVCKRKHLQILFLKRFQGFFVKFKPNGFYTKYQAL